MPEAATTDCSACQMLATRPHLAGALVHSPDGCDGAPFNPGTGPMPGYVVGNCGHPVPQAQWQDGVHDCDRCTA